MHSGWDHADDEPDTVELCARDAYEEAGIGPRDLDVVELHDASAPAEIIAYEQLGLCAKGDGGQLVESGATRLGGRMPVNTSGGLLRKGHPVGATGLAQIVELTEQLQGRSGKRQVEGARLGARAERRRQEGQRRRRDGGDDPPGLRGEGMRERNEMILADLVANPRRGEARSRRAHLRAREPRRRRHARRGAHLRRSRRATPTASRRRWSRRGVGRGDRFAVMMRNHPEFVEAMIAASMTGRRLRADRSAHARRRSSPSCCATPAAPASSAPTTACPQLEAVRADVPDLRWILALETGEGGTDTARRRWRRAARRDPGGADAEPRSARRAHEPRCRSCTRRAPPAIRRASSATTRASAPPACSATLFGYRPDERPYTGLSLTHGNAQSVTLAPALLMGLRAVFSRRFTKSRLWDVCRRHGCTTFSLVGGMATAIYSEPPRADDADNPVRLVVSGGMPPAIWEAVREALRRARCSSSTARWTAAAWPTSRWARDRSARSASPCPASR